MKFWGMGNTSTRKGDIRLPAARQVHGGVCGISRMSRGNWPFAVCPVVAPTLGDGKKHKQQVHSPNTNILVGCHPAWAGWLFVCFSRPIFWLNWRRCQRFGPVLSKNEFFGPLITKFHHKNIARGIEKQNE